MKRKFLAMFIVVLMLFSQTTAFAIDLNSFPDTINPENKLTNELKGVMNDTSNDAYIPIVVWLDDYGDDLVYLSLSNKYGFNINPSNEHFYINSKIIAKSNEYIEKSKNKVLNVDNKQLLLKQPISPTNKNFLNFNENITENEINQFIESSMTVAEVIEMAEKIQFVCDWRESRKSINSAISSTFVNKLNKRKTSNVQSNDLLTCVFLSCEKSYIYTLAKFSEVKAIEYSNYKVESVISNVEESPIETSNEHHMLSQNYLGYDGTGIKVGVLELKVGTNKVLLDTNNVHLKDKFSNGKINTNYSFCAVEEADRAVSDHATLVTSILCGNEVNGYKGVAQNAIIYYAPFDSFPLSTNVMEGGLFDAIDWLINDCKVSVINMSCGARYSQGNDLTYYSFIDQYFDCLVSQYRVTIIKSSGNNQGRISSPGFAMNVITVGNLTKTITQGMYTINTTSSYDEGETANKPDVVAFGTNVYMYGDSATSLVSNSGTSFSAPQVAGTVALMMQANANLIGKPDAIKAILISSAKSDIYPLVNAFSVITNNGTQATYDTTLRAGGGLVNTLESVKQALRDDFQRVCFTPDISEFVTNRYWIYKDQPIEFTLAYEKSDHTILSSPYAVDINVQVLNSNNEVMFDSLHAAHTETCESCISGVDNVESFKLTLPENGFYTFKIYVFKGVFEDASDTVIPTVHEFEHDGVYASLALSCGCNNKNIQSVFSQTYSYEHTCSNCQVSFWENYSYDTETIDISCDGSYCGYIKYSIKFRMNPTTGVNIDDSFKCEFIKADGSHYNVVVIIDGGNLQYTSTGYKQTYEYMFIPYDLINEEYKSPIYDSIQIVYDTRIEYSAYLVN